MLILVTLNKWVSRQVDFVLAFPQADIECPLYMEIPRGFQSEGTNPPQLNPVKLDPVMTYIS
jgi:hypothetical protein